MADEQRATKDTDRKPEKEKINRGHQHRESISQKEKEPIPKEPKPAKPPPRAKKAVKEEEGYGTELYNWNPPVKKKVELKLVVPEKLKAVMVDDWEAVTRKGQVCVNDG